MSRLRDLPFTALLVCATGFGQTPLISPGGIVNAASGITSDPGHYGLAPGSLASLFGSNLAPGSSTATATPLPYSLLGTSVSVGGMPAPILYVSPTQINFQVPNHLVFSTSDLMPIPVIVTTASGGASAPATIEGGEIGSGVFTLSGGGCGPGAIQNVSSSGAVSLNSTNNSASPGQFITAYGTGFGLVIPIPGDGQPASSQPPQALQIGVGGTFDGVFAEASFTGLVPGLVGVNQANFQIPASVREGCAVPLTVSTSQPVTLSIHHGGGACADPPAAADSTVLLQRVSTVGTANDGVVETLDAAFTQSPGRIATLIRPPAPTFGFGPSLPSPTCPVPGYVQLDAGPLSLFGPSTTINGMSAAPGGVYHVVLPPGTLQTGLFTLAPTAPGTVGPFQASIPFGRDIHILSPAPAVGSTLMTGGSITPTWSGGDPGSVVTVSLISHYPQTQFINSCQALASAGQCTFSTLSLSMGFLATRSGTTDHGEILYEVDPAPASVTSFSALGLSLGGQATWRILHSFQGFAIQ